MTSLIFFTLWEGVTNSRSRKVTKMQRIVMKFGMFVIGLGENAVSTDELAQRKNIFGTLQWNRSHGER